MQKIYFGAPGTGKSYLIDEYLKSHSVPNDRVFRVTFHPEFSYSDFTGQLLPTIIKSGPRTGDITYDYAKGVFTLALEKAYQDTSKDVFLVIEEMSRGNCSSIFGDIFQLLDRENSGTSRGFSRYFINNEMIAKDIVAITDDRVKLPPNLSILGTVNTSDQNVFAIDTAFKRRFSWEYVSTNPVGSPYKNNPIIKINNGTTIIDVEWVNLYMKLNRFISSDLYLGLGEDKQIGQFFIEFDLSKSWVEHKEQLINKLLYYLWFDIHQSSYRSTVKLFDSRIGNFGELFSESNLDNKIFSDGFLALL